MARIIRFSPKGLIPSESYTMALFSHAFEMIFNSAKRKAPAITAARLVATVISSSHKNPHCFSGERLDYLKSLIEFA